MKNAIITGGAGFIASNLTPSLLALGFEKNILIDNLMRTQGLRNVIKKPQGRIHIW